MKLLTLICFYLLIFSSCNFSVGVKKDLKTGLTTKNNGLSVENVIIVDSSGSAINPSTIQMGESFQIVAVGVDNFKEKNGRVYPGCKLQLKDPNGKMILDIEDAYANLTNGASVTDAQTLTATFRTGNPMVKGETYIASVVFFDKENLSNKIESKVDIVTK